MAIVVLRYIRDAQMKMEEKKGEAENRIRIDKKNGRRDCCYAWVCTQEE
jgi:hypothetical protein